ncbi:MAG TPA: SIMPL domain-containing protein [Solirubrobacteraceae bacterium]|jgi:hypothetical protein
MRTLIALTAALALVPATTAGAQAPAEPTTLSVTGTGTVQAKPDTATISIDVRRVGVERERPRTSVNRRTRQIIGAVRRLGVRREDIQTSGITLDEQRLRPRHKGGRTRIRYVAHNSLTVRTTALEVVGRIFDVATRAGATDFSGPEFEVVNRTPHRADATAAAVDDARRRADAAARALGLRVVGVRSISLDPSEPTRTFDEAGALPVSGEADGGESTPVTPGLEDIGAVVSVVFVLGT